MSDSAWVEEALGAFAFRLDEGADSERAEAQAAYMRHQFSFFGLTSPERRVVLKSVLGDVGRAESMTQLDQFARRCYELPQREWHYLAVDVLKRHHRLLTAADLDLMHHLVTTHAWWDTVDDIASNLVGRIVQRHEDSVAVMDQWVASPHMWVARTAILHQLKYKEATDTERLFAYCLARADESDFFYRKAIGWALRQYSRTDPEAVRAFCDQHEDALSALTLKEARKYV